MNFWSKVDKKGENDCWPFKGKARSGKGYGQVKQGKLKLGAHRLAFELTHGYMPTQVRHACDNPICCNPRHLLPGTAQDNKQDAIDRQRHAKGSTVGTAKLTEDDVRQIRAHLAAGDLLKNIAARYNVSIFAISQIKLGHTWRHVK